VFVGVTNTSQCTRIRWNRLIIAENFHRSYQESVKQERHSKVAMRVEAEVNHTTRTKRWSYSLLYVKAKQTES